MRLLPKWIQAISKNVSAQWNIRPTLAWVHVTNTHVSATDSFIAIRVELAEKWKSEEFPGENLTELPEWGIIIPSRLIDWMKFKNSKIWAEILDDKCVIRSLDDDKISLVITDLDDEISYKAKVIKWAMPDLEHFHQDIIKNPATDRVWVSCEKMIEMLKTMQAIGHKDVIIETRSTSGIIVQPYERNDYSTWWLVMPLKITD